MINCRQAADNKCLCCSVGSDLLARCKEDGSGVWQFAGPAAVTGAVLSAQRHGIPLPCHTHYYDQLPSLPECSCFSAEDW